MANIYDCCDLETNVSKGSDNLINDNFSNFLVGYFGGVGTQGSLSAALFSVLYLMFSLFYHNSGKRSQTKSIIPSAIGRISSPEMDIWQCVSQAWFSVALFRLFGRSGDPSTCQRSKTPQRPTSTNGTAFMSTGSLIFTTGAFFHTLTVRIRFAPRS